MDVHLAPAVDDLSSSFGALRSRLVGADGRTYREVREGLRTRSWVVWFDLGATWLALLAAAVVTIALHRAPWPVALLGVVAMASAVGVLVHRVGLFVHEGAHGNVAPGRHNDLVTNLAAGWLVLTDVRDYRPFHLAHHRYLGTTRDTERTYFQRLDGRFCWRALLGLQVLEVMRYRSRTATGGGTPRRAVPALGALVHAGLVAVTLLLGWWLLTIVWITGVAMVHPFVQSLRQLAEHRHDAASGDIDYRLVDQGAFTRMFSRDPSRGLIGGAGFNRHLIHHWDAGVSYTRLRELERWLAGTKASSLLEARGRRYLPTLHQLWRQ